MKGLNFLKILFKLAGYWRQDTICIGDCQIDKIPWFSSSSATLSKSSRFLRQDKKLLARLDGTWFRGWFNLMFSLWYRCQIVVGTVDVEFQGISTTDRIIVAMYNCTIALILVALYLRLPAKIHCWIYVVIFVFVLI